MNLPLQFECETCGDAYEKDVEPNEQLPLFGMCPACEFLYEKAEDEE